MTIPTTINELHRWLHKEAKTKRFELRISPDLLRAVQEYADDRGLSVSDAVRYLVARGVAKG